MSFLLPTLLLATLPPCAAGEAAVPCAPKPPPHARTLRPPSREQVAMRMMVRRLLLERYDADGNLELDREERHRLMADAHAARKQQALAFIRRFDADGDGRLNPEERAAMHKAMEERRRTGQGAAGTPLPPPPPPPFADGRHGHHDRHHHGHRPRHPHMGKDGRTVAFLIQQLTMDAYDSDRNAHLDREESARLREDGAKLYKAREAELLARFDTDKNSNLSEGELQAALQALPPPPPPLHHAEGDMPPPPRHHRRRGPIHRLLDTHFDIDILINLARPQAERAGSEQPLPPCSLSTPSAN